MQCILVSTICGPIGCAVDFLCRLLHLEIILPKKPLRTALCNKAIQNWKAAMNRFSIMFEERVTKYF